MMAKTIEGLSAEIQGLVREVGQLRQYNQQQFTEILSQLGLMNGRQRKNTDDIATNRQGVATLSTRLELAVHDVREDQTRKSVAVGLMSIAEAAAAFFAALLAKP